MLFTKKAIKLKVIAKSLLIDHSLQKNIEVINENIFITAVFAKIKWGNFI